MVGNEKKKLVKKPRQSSFVAGLNKRQDAIDYLTTRAVNQTREISKQAETTAKANIAKKNKTNKALTAKHGSMYDYTKVMQIQKQLKDAGFYKGAIDGDWSKGTQAAWEAYSAQEQSKPRDIYSAARGNFQAIGAALAEAPKENDGSVIYLNYPNFSGQGANALKIGNLDVGKAIFGSGNVLPVGHGELIAFDKDGNAKHIRYGRYTTGTGAEIRSTKKGGNWAVRDYPKRNQGESAQDYINRIKGQLEDSAYGNFEAIEIPGVNSNAIVQYAVNQSNDRNRPTYGITNTCATGATDAIEAGLSTQQKGREFLPIPSYSKANEGVSQFLWGNDSRKY